MLVRFLPGALVGLLLVGAALIVGEGCSDFEATEDPIPDASVAADVSTSAEAEAAVDAGPLSFCEAQDATFCTDFETPPLQTGFAQPLVAEGLVTLLDGGAPDSPLHAFQSDILDAGGDAADGALETDASGALQAAVLFHAFKASVDGPITYEADLRVDDLRPPNVGGMVTAFGISSEESEANDSVVVAFGRDSDQPSSIGGALAASIGETPMSAFFHVQKGVGAWFHLRVTIDRKAQTVALSIDGVAAAGLAPTPVFAGRTQFNLNVGILAARSEGRLAMSFDNVLLNAK